MKKLAVKIRCYTDMVQHLSQRIQTKMKFLFCHVDRLLFTTTLSTGAFAIIPVCATYFILLLQ